MRRILTFLLVFPLAFPTFAYAELDEPPCHRVARIIDSINGIELRAILHAYGIHDPESCEFPREATLLHVAVRNKRLTDVLDTLIEMGVDHNSLDFRGQTPMGRAVSADNVAAVETLFKYGDSHKVENEDGKTALGKCRAVLEYLPDSRACLRLIELDEGERSLSDSDP